MNTLISMLAFLSDPRRELHWWRLEWRLARAR